MISVQYTSSLTFRKRGCGADIAFLSTSPHFTQLVKQIITSADRNACCFKICSPNPLPWELRKGAADDGLHRTQSLVSSFAMMFRLDCLNVQINSVLLLGPIYIDMTSYANIAVTRTPGTSLKVRAWRTKGWAIFLRLWIYFSQQHGGTTRVARHWYQREARCLFKENVSCLLLRLISTSDA